jgi:hypothetical protein
MSSPTSSNGSGGSGGGVSGSPSGLFGSKGGFAKTLSKGVTAAGDLGMAMQGYQTGGLVGGVETGLGVLGTIAAVAPHFGPWGMAIAAVAAGLSMFHPHYSPSANPDMYSDDGYAQGYANAAGQSYTQANGTMFEDSNLKSQLGGMSELQYLSSWYNKYPNGANLNSDGLSLWQEIGKVTGNGKGVGLGGLHQGNIYVTDGGGNQVGMNGNWQNVLQTIDTDTQDLYQMLTSDQSVTTPIISVNSYGGSGSNESFSPWTTPGLSSGEITAVLNAPYGAAAAAMGVQSGAGISGMPTAATGGYPSSSGNINMSVGDQSLAFTHNVNIDGQAVAQIVNAYNNQRQTAGFQPNT